MKKNFEMKSGTYRFKIKNGKSKPEISQENLNFPKSSGGNEEHDINLMMIFGMEKEAKNKDPEKYNKIKKRFDNSRTASGKQEYICKEQNHEFNEGYRKKFTGAKVKLVFSFLLFLCCVAFEYVMGRTVIIQEILFRYSPVVVALFSLQLVVLCLALGYKHYFTGLLYKSGKRAGGIVFTVLGTACFVYYVVLSVMLATGNAALTSVQTNNFYLSALSFCLILAVFEEINHIKREWKSFLAVSDNSYKYKYTLEKNTKVGGKRFSKKAWSVKKTEFVSGFVSRCDSGVKKKNFGILMFIAFVLALCLAGYRYFVTRDILSAFSALMISLMFTLPFSAFITFSSGYKKAVDKAYENNCAIIGLSTFDNLQSASAVYFDDLAVFPPSGVKLKGFKTYGRHRIDHSLSTIASVYSKIDAPPAPLFRKTVGIEDIERNVDIIEVSGRGIYAAVDGKPVYMGSAEYMEKCGFLLPEGYEDDPNPKVCVMYLAMSGSVAMKLYIEYLMDENIYSHIETLRKYGIYLGVCTCDPNINDVTMNKRIPLSKYPVGILKSAEEKAAGQIASQVNSGIASNTGTADLLSTLLLCINTAHSVKTDMIVKYFSLAAGVLISFFVTFFGVEGHINSWFFILYQFFWLIPSFLISRFGPRS